MSGNAETRTLNVPTDGAENTSLTVTVIEGPDRGRQFAIDSRRAAIGRGEDADVRLADPAVSQFHVEFTATAHGVALTDLQSRNGTRVGEVLIREATVPFGAEIVVGSTRLRIERGRDHDTPPSKATSFGGLLGTSRVMRELYATLERLARTDLAVLLQGDTGTGKEVAARGLHDASSRRDGRFVALDCTAIPASLAESVLFGHEKGAFTGATSRREGVFEAADGGTLMLDEIGELTADLQPKLLRVLERREVTPVGGTRVIPVNVRIVAASWRDLRALVNRGSFREDLYHRLAQSRVRLPSLAERPDDVRPLVQHFLARIPFGTVAARSITDDALELLAARTFSGNVRELKNTVERLAMLADGSMITADDIAFDRRLDATRDPAAVREAASSERAPDDAPIEPYKEAKRSIVDEFERDYLRRLMERAGTNISLAARLAGIERPSLRELLKRHGLRDAE